MPDITDLPVMTRADAIAAGFAGYNDVPHKPIDVPDGAFTITAKTSEGRRVTFCFLEKTYGGPPRFIDIQFHDRGTTIPNADNGVSPTFNAFAITRGGRFVADSRPLDEDIKPSILVLMLDKAGEEPARSATKPAPMSDTDLAALLTRAAEVVAAPDSRIASHRNTLAGQLIAEAAIRRARPS
ncbi:MULTISPECIES: hypothetical protein [Sphingomonas]|uniref:Uncharacterized protein n=2 Tax=Sphingomonas TaxID=13687 RepID=A0ABX0XQ79_9SPHN|nr:MULTISPECIES: hypothetical protein [Sphingomonas]NJC35419.1 hypothetical protein [Sphingomonas jejuensis]